MPRPAPCVAPLLPYEGVVPDSPQASRASPQRRDATQRRLLAMARALPLLALLLAGAAQAAERFTGSVSVRQDRQHSEDGRFSMTATLRAGEAHQRNGRFELIARMDASAEAKATAAACSAGGVIFRDGFE